MKHENTEMPNSRNNGSGPDADHALRPSGAVRQRARVRNLKCRHISVFHRHAFTIIELLIVVGIITLLVGLIVVSLRGVQNMSARTNSVNSLRQMMTGYLGYAGDHRNRLMPGYVDYSKASPTDNLPELNMRFRSGAWMVPPNAALAERENLGPYVWRLTPYLQHEWRTMMTDYADSGIASFFVDQVGQYEPGDSIFGPADVPTTTPAKSIPTVGTAPAYGLNSIFLGGDNRHGGPDIYDLHPWQSKSPRIAATRLSEAVNQRVVVFAPTALVNPEWDEDDPDSPVFITPNRFAQPRGYAELRPPFIEQNNNGVWTNRQWRVAERGAIRPMSNLVNTAAYVDGAGLPITRRGAGQLPVGRLDGSAEMEDIVLLSRDMRNWSPFETGQMPPAYDTD